MAMTPEAKVKKQVTRQLDAMGCLLYTSDAADE